MNSGNNMIVRFSAVITKEGLENVAETSGIMVPSIFTTEVNTIKIGGTWVAIQIFLEQCG